LLVKPTFDQRAIASTDSAISAQRPTTASSKSVQPVTMTKDSHLKPTTAKHTIASIVYLNQYGIPYDTLQHLKQEHASEVYLYVAYYSDAYFNIDKNPYGMVCPIDTLQSALRQLHGAGYRVTAVISSALLDPRQAPKAGLDILQPHGDIFEPKRAKPLLTQMVRHLSQYPVDGIYVGEPYFTKQTQSRGLTPQQKNEWLDLYQSLISITHKAKIPFHMILPDNFIVGADGHNESGMPDSFVKLPFDEIGMDIENAYTGHQSDDLKQFDVDVKKTKEIAGNRPSIIEISLRCGDLKTAIPAKFFDQEVQIITKYHISKIVLFADEFWPKSHNLKEYQTSLLKFINSK
jgi:hypothetical protein